MKVTTAARTDVGKIRELNEDNYFVSEDSSLLIVADGMGGHAAGEVASEMAVNIISLCMNAMKGEDKEPSKLLSEAISDANRQIFREASISEDKKGMGTTVVSAMMLEESAIIAHVGDSRAYLIRDRSIEMFTDDHSWVNVQVRLGNMTAEQAEKHPLKNIITKALGIQDEVDADVYKLALRNDDYILLCSDGLSGMISDKTILEIVTDPEIQGMDNKVTALIDAALANGGEDNVTAVLVQVQGIEGPMFEDTQPLSYAISHSSSDEDEEVTQIIAPRDNPALAAEIEELAAEADREREEAEARGEINEIDDEAVTVEIPPSEQPDGAENEGDVATDGDAENGDGESDAAASEPVEEEK